MLRLVLAIAPRAPQAPETGPAQAAHRAESSLPPPFSRVLQLAGDSSAFTVKVKYK